MAENEAILLQIVDSCQVGQGTPILLALALGLSPAQVLVLLNQVAVLVVLDPVCGDAL